MTTPTRSELFEPYTPDELRLFAKDVSLQRSAGTRASADIVADMLPVILRVLAYLVEKQPA